MDMADFGDAIHPRTGRRLTIKSEDYANLFDDYGFDAVLKINQLQNFTNNEARKFGVTVRWYAEKRALT